jgi:hypothetical protein
MTPDQSAHRPDVVSDTKAKISKLDLHEGDTLVVMVPQVLSAEARILYVRFMRDNLPPGVKCMVLDGGVTLDKLKREHEAEVDSQTYRDTFGPKAEKPGKVGWWQRWMG